MSQDPSSRHDALATYEVERGPGQAPLEIFEPRPIPQPPASVVHTVAAADRLDLLAQLYLGDPFQYWRIADANPTLTPEDVLDPGATIAIPPRT